MEKTMKNMFLFLCTAVVLTGCAGNENQDEQQITTIDFQDLVKDHDGQNHEIQNHESELSTAANSDTFESDSSPQESTDYTQQNETALDLYAGFIKNEVPAITAPDYPQNDYITYNLEPGKSYTFATLGDYVNKRYLNPEYSEKTTYDDAQYVYLDCPGSSAKNLLVKFSGLGIYAPEDEFITKRRLAITAREMLITAIQNSKSDYKQLAEIKEYYSRVNTLNIEQLAAKLLFDLTRNTGFEVSKGFIGNCWIVSCCEWAKRQPDDICGLDKNRLSLTEKMQTIMQNTSLEAEFRKAGMEATL